MSGGVIVGNVRKADPRPATPTGCKCGYHGPALTVPPYRETEAETRWRRQVDTLLDRLDALGLCKWWSYDHVVSAALGRPACWHEEEGREGGVAYLKSLLEAQP